MTTTQQEDRMTTYYNTYGYGYSPNRPEGWTSLGHLDESADYEVDQTEIFWTEDGRFVLATASGCSCWDGEWNAETFDTLDALAKSISPVGDARQYNPSASGGASLVAEARAKLDVLIKTLD
jgi:hypothetical protein